MNLKFYLVIGLSLLLLSCKTQTVETMTDQQIDEYWQTGKTLPDYVCKQYPLKAQPVKADKGINVLIDLTHQCKFATLWGMPGRLNNMGYRAIGSQATLDKVLDPNGKCRVRIPWNEEKKIYPFAWHPNFKYNVVITSQTDFNAQHYMPAEQEALVKFVKQGGGLVIFGNTPKTDDAANSWSLNDLCKRFKASIIAKKDKYREQNYAVIETNKEWEPLAKGENGSTVAAVRKFGKGYVAIYGSEELLNAKRKDKEGTAVKNNLLLTVLNKVSKGKKPVGGEACYPQPLGGGGGIYPENEVHFNDIVLFYADNQKPELLRTVHEDIPKAKELVEGWLPSKPTLEPMYLILSSGGGGGWAVNAHKPKENGIISLSPHGIISIFAHELAHTMHGPVNDENNVAGITPIPNRGEAHAGWFQGKVDAWFEKSLREEPVKRCNNLFTFDPTGDKLDLVSHYENEALRKEYGKGKDWVKTWWIWQKLDDKYGSTWYPRWKYVQHTRWKKDPTHRLTWDEMVEDMSIAVGEDLFPFLNKAGLSLQRNRLKSIEFNGETLSLKPAQIEVSKAGKVRLETIGNYKEALK